jgi:hypothetical protein
MPPTRVKYDLLPPGAHTILPVDDPKKVFDPGLGFNAIVHWERINLNDVAEVEDLNDPKSHRAYQVRGHLYGFGTPDRPGYQGPLCTLIKGPAGDAQSTMKAQAAVEASSPAL